MELDRHRIETIVHAAGDRLDGDWLLVGGALVALWLEPARTTEDVDLISVHPTSETRLALLRLADDLGLPVEVVNTAADFFVERIPGWRDEIEVLHRGTRGTVHRPSATLFLLLKIGRLSERDLADCVAMLAKAAAESVAIDIPRVLAAVDALPPTDDDALAARRASLRARLV